MFEICKLPGWAKRLHLSGFLLLLGLCSPATAILTEEVTDVLISPAAYILDSDGVDGDPGTIRNGLQTQARAEIDRSTITDPVVDAEYRVIYQLLDSAGTPLPLKNRISAARPTVAANAPFPVILNIFDFAPVVRIEVLYPDPVATLDNKEGYRVVAALEKRPDALSPWAVVVNSDETSPPELVHHFTSTDPDDDEYNIRATVSDLSWDRIHALQTDPAGDFFEASINATFARYDDWENPASLVTTLAVYDFDLFENSTGNEIPLEDDGQVQRSFKMNSIFAGGPSFLSFTESVELRPLSQLKAGSETYVLRCTVRHREMFLGFPMDDAACDLPDQRLLHFNGNLAFGAINTVFNGLGNIPVPVTINPTSVDTAIRIPSGNGVLPNASPYAFGNNAGLQVRLLDNGNATLLAGSQSVYLPGAPGDPVLHDNNCLTYQYGAVTLGTGGMNANGIQVRLPQGLIYLPDITISSHHGEPTISRPGVIPLASNLNILSDIAVTFGANAALVDESQPLSFGTGEVKILTGGTLDFVGVSYARYIHAKAFNQLANDLGSGQIEAIDNRGLALADRASNDLYMREVIAVDNAQVRVQAAADKSSRLSASLDLAASKFQTHFPAYAEVNWQDDSNVVIDQGTPAGSTLENTNLVALSYHRTCPEDVDPCASGVPKEKLEAVPDSGQLFQTPTGGLFTYGFLNSPAPLAWGARGDGQTPAAIDPNYPYAHRTSDFTLSDFFMPGYQLYAEDNPLLTTAPYAAGGGDFAPGALLLAGFSADIGAPEMHFPTESEYVNGDGAYPGLNFMVRDGGEIGASRLAGEQSDYPYELFNDGASKYYSRCAGVFGRQVAVDGSFNSSLNLYGYDFELSSFQLSFIASAQEESWINGAVGVTGYSNFNQRFLGLNLTCLGELGDAELDPGDTSTKNLVFWNSTFEAKSLRFETTPLGPPGACPLVYDGFLTMGIKTQVAYIPQPLYGTFAFNPSDGNLLTQTSGSAIGVDCELGLPASISMDGPGDDYSLVPVGKLRYSNPIEFGALPGDLGGFITFGATINVPYFRDLLVQVMTSANGIPPTEGGEPPTPPLYLTPGFGDSGGRTFFDNANFDPNHICWPKAAGISLDEFRSPTASTLPQFLIKAEQDLFGVIGLKYPLRWTDGTRHFESMNPEQDDLFILNIEHQIDYLDADATKVSFGAKYDGLPEINLANMLNEQIDGASDAVAAAITAPLRSALDLAFEKFEDFLADSLDAVIDPIIDEAATLVICPLYDDLEAAYNASPDWGTFEAQLNAQVSAQIYNSGAPGLATNLRQQLEKLSDTGQQAASLTGGLKEALEKIIIGLDVLVHEVEVDGSDHPVFRPDPFTAINPSNDVYPGILLQNGAGEFTIVENLIKELLKQVTDPAVAAVIQPLVDSLASELNAELNAVLEDQKDKLLRLVTIAQEVRTVLKEIYVIVDDASGFIDDFNTMVTQAITAVDGFQEIMAKPATRAIAFLKGLAQQNGIDITNGGVVLNNYPNLFEEFDKQAFVDTIKAELKDALMQSQLMQQFKYLVRQTLYDVQAKFEQAVGVMLAQVSGIMKELISETIGALEDQINPLLGNVNDYMGAAEVTGYAEFNGDSLRKLRLDASMQFKIPDEMQLNVFLEICSYTSVDENACVGPGDRTVEVTVGALDVPFDWISEGLKASLAVKMCLKDTGSGLRPHGVGGEFEITDGTIDFQSFKITCLKATLAVGGDECYFGTRACGIFNSYEMSIGIFFGRICTPAPLTYVDEDVGSLFNVSDLPITGAYVYGEVWLPISEIVLGIPASCLFNISAGVGAGVGFFLDDSFSPIFVGKMFAGVSGEALCIVSIKGSVTLVGIVQNGSFSATGTGKLKGKAGWCPFCVKFSVSAKISYKNGDWDVDY